MEKPTVELDEVTKTYIKYIEMRLELAIKENRKLKQKLNDPVVTIRAAESLKLWK